MTNVRPLFPPGHARHIPEAWPALLSPDQLCAYVGGMSRDTVAKICPVAPVDLGASLLRYPRDQVDQWIANLKPRAAGLNKIPDAEKDTAVPAPGDEATGVDRAQAALDRVRDRVRRSAPCRKTG